MYMFDIYIYIYIIQTLKNIWIVKVDTKKLVVNQLLREKNMLLKAQLISPSGAPGLKQSTEHLVSCHPSSHISIMWIRLN